MTTWMTRSESAAYLGVSLPTLDRMARAGKISKAIWGKRTVMFARDQLDQYRTERTGTDRYLSSLAEVLKLVLPDAEADRIEAELRKATERVEQCEHSEFMAPRGVCHHCRASLAALAALGLPPGPVLSSDDVRVSEEERKEIWRQVQEAVERDDERDLRRR